MSGKSTNSRSNKTEVSMILQQQRDWHDASKELPDANEPVVFRFVNKGKVYAEDDENIIYAEDIKVGRFASNYDDPSKGVWKIDPPFPKYDFSPLSKNDQLLEGSVVTHWAKVSDEELEGWKTRFDPIGEYHGLSIRVAPEEEELVYRALLRGANAIARMYNIGAADVKNDPQQREIYMMYAVLNDLQFCIDTNSHIVNGEQIPNFSPVDTQTLFDTKYLYNELCNRYGDDVHEVIEALKIIDDQSMIGNLEFDENDEEGNQTDAVDSE